MYRERIREELRTLEGAVLWSEKAHFKTAEQFSISHYILGIVAIATSSATAAAIWQDHSLVSSVLALVTALSTALITFMKPQATAERHIEAGRCLTDLRARIRQTLDVDGEPDSGVPDSTLRERLDQLTAMKKEAHQDAPLTGMLAYRRANRQIEAGEHGDRWAVLSATWWQRLWAKLRGKAHA